MDRRQWEGGALYVGQKAVRDRRGSGREGAAVATVEAPHLPAAGRPQLELPRLSDCDDDAFRSRCDASSVEINELRRSSNMPDMPRGGTGW
jgi:hypothetical protein